MASSRSAKKLSHDYPSGSYWKAKEVEAVRFAAQPIQQELRQSTVDEKLSDENNNILQKLLVTFTVSLNDIENEEILRDEPHEVFYQTLAKLLTPAQIPSTPNQPRTRNTIFNKSSSPLVFNDESQETPKAQSANEQETPKVPSRWTTSPGSSPPMPGSTGRPRNSYATPSPTRRPPAIDRGSETPHTTASKGSAENSPTRQGHTAIPSDTNHPASTLRSSLLSSAPTESEAVADVDATPMQRFLDADFRSSQTDSTYETASVATPISSHLPGRSPEKLVDELYLHFLRSLCNAYNKTKGYNFTVDFGSEMKIIIAGDEINTTPDLTLSVKIEGKFNWIPMFDLESKSPSQDEKYGQKVSELLARAKEMRDRNAQHPYSLYLLSAQGVNLRLTTCTLSPSYMKQLERDPFNSRYPPIEVEEYGPIDMSDPESRVLAASTIYKLMIRCANRIVEDERRKAENTQKIQEARSGRSKS